MNDHRVDTDPNRHLSRTELRALVHELPRELRELRHRTLVETLAAGAPVRADALTIVLTAHDEHSEIPLRFTRVGVAELLWFGVTSFCDTNGLRAPEGCVAALHAALAIAIGSELIDPASDAPGELFAAFADVGRATASFSPI